MWYRYDPQTKIKMKEITPFVAATLRLLTPDEQAHADKPSSEMQGVFARLV
jgi:hypothetical protein